MSQFPPPSLISTDEDVGARGTGKIPCSVETTEAACIAAISGPVVDVECATLTCRRGVPDKVREVYWKLMVGVLPPETAKWEELRKAQASEYHDLVRVVCTLDEDENVVICENSNREVDIDIPRTMPTLHFFNSQRDFTIMEGIPTVFSPTQQSLRRILHTLAGVNKGLGYVQGMNELVGHLLFAFTRGEPGAVDESVEAQVFFIFQRMLAYLGDDFCRSLDFDQDTGVMSTIRNFEHMVQFLDEELWNHLESNEIRSEFYAFRWLTLLFTQEFNAPDVFRIWDFIFSFREELRGAIIYTAVAMLIYKRDEILKLDHLSTILPFLQSYPPCDVGEFLEIAALQIMRYGFQVVGWLKLSSKEEIEGLRVRYRFNSSGAPSWRQNITGWVNSVRKLMD